MRTVRDTRHQPHALHAQAWAILLLAITSISILVGHDAAYFIGGGPVDPHLHEYMGGAAHTARWVLAASVLVMVRRIFARDGAVDAFLEIAGPRVVATRVLLGGAIATAGLLAVEVGERAAGEESITLPAGLIAGIVLTQCATAAVVLVLPAWTRAGVRGAIVRVRGILIRIHATSRDAPVDTSDRAIQRAPHRMQRAGIAWRRRAIPLRGSPG